MIATLSARKRGRQRQGNGLHASRGGWRYAGKGVRLGCAFGRAPGRRLTADAASRRQMGGAAAGRDPRDRSEAVVAAIRGHGGGRQRVERSKALPADAHPTVMDRRAQSATGPADGAILARLCWPEARWRPRTMDLSINRSDRGERRAKSSNTFSRIPRLTRRSKRLSHDAGTVAVRQVAPRRPGAPHVEDPVHRRPIVVPPRAHGLLWQRHASSVGSYRVMTPSPHDMRSGSRHCPERKSPTGFDA